MQSIDKKIEEMFASKKGWGVYNSITAFIEKYSMQAFLDKGVLVGFSGGPDSVFLLSFLHYYRTRQNLDFNISAAHIHHMIRGESADRDAEFAEEFCKVLGVDFYLNKINVPLISATEHIGIEEAARNARYSTFEDIIRGRSDINAIALAHNASDNTETVLLNMLRGSGVLGMGGISPVRDNIIRPLIVISKKEITSLLESFAIPYVIDESNLTDEYSRNYIRNNVSPLLEKLTENPDMAVLRMSENMRSAFDYIEQSCQSVIDGLGDISRFEVSRIRGLHRAVLSRIFSVICQRICGKTPEEKHISLFCKEVMKDNFTISIPGEYDFVCERGVCTFVKKEKVDIFGIIKLEFGKNKIDGYALTVFVGEKLSESSLNVYKKSIHLRVPSVIIENGLYLRTRRDGDAYRYGGMTHRLKKVFNDRNIPPFMRDLVPVLCDEEGIIFVPGLKICDRIRNDEASVWVTLCYEEPTPGESVVYTADKLT